MTNIEKIREKRLEAIRSKKAKQARKRNEKEERLMMRHEDYDVTNVLAGLVEAINSDEGEEEEESEIMMEDESFFEVIPQPQDEQDIEKSNQSGKTGKERMTGRSIGTKKSGISRNEIGQSNMNVSGVGSRLGLMSRQGTRGERVSRQTSRVGRMNRSGTLMSRGNNAN